MLSLILFIATFQGALASDGLEQVYENSRGSPLISLIQSAEKTIDVEIYEMDDPDVLGALKKAVLNGVRVRVVKEVEPVGKPCLIDASTPSSSSACQTQREFARFVRKAGGEYVAYNHQALCGKPGTTCYQHGKLVIVDGQTAMMSTGNFNSSNLCNKNQNVERCNRDYSIVTKDAEVVGELTQIFENDLKGHSYNLPAVMNAGSPRLTVSPYSLDPLVKMVQSAKKSIILQNQYLNEPNFNKALVEAAKRGVKISVMVASACSFARPKPRDIAKWTKIYSEFDRAGIESRAFTGSIQIGGVRGYMHAKVMVVDGSTGWVGSVNGSTTSFSNNREFGIFFTDPEQVRKLSDWINSDFRADGSETWKESLECLHDPAPERE